MEKAAGAGVGAGASWEVALGCMTALAASVLCPVAQAEEAGRGAAQAVVAQAQVEAPVRLQLQTSALPRFDAQDSGFQAPRVDLSITGLNRGGTGLSPVLGMASPGAGMQALGLQPRTSIDLGLRWTQRLQSQRQIDITAWRRLNAPDDAYSLVQMNNPVYGARVEMNLAGGRRSGLALDMGFIGFQMESGARITVKRKDGRPMIYYRTVF
jgi:hypothetical protein